MSTAFSSIMRRHVVSRQQRLRPAGPLVRVVSALATHAHLERVEAVLLAQARESASLLHRVDVAAHTRCVDRERPRRPAEQLAHALPLLLATEIPERRIHAADRSHEIRARKLELSL